MLEVLAAHGVLVHLQENDGYTPTPVISHAILVHNAERQAERADGLVITPSHNPPHGGPADSDVTGWIEQRANALLADGNRGVKRLPYAAALSAATTRPAWRKKPLSSS